MGRVEEVATSDEWDGTRIWLAWVAANAAGELVGLGAVGALGGVAMVALGASAPPVLQAAVLIALGGVDGAVVGLAQHSVLRHALPSMARRRWVVATIAGALVAWVLGMIPSTVMQLATEASASTSGAPAEEPPMVLVMLLAAGLGAIAGPVLAYAQYFELRRHVRGALLWLPAHAAAWALAMPVIFLAAGAMPETGPDAGWVATALAALAGAGAIVGGVHGLALVRLAARPISPAP
jgi:hypothetical protein